MFRSLNKCGGAHVVMVFFYGACSFRQVSINLLKKKNKSIIKSSYVLLLRCWRIFQPQFFDKVLWLGKNCFCLCHELQSIYFIPYLYLTEYFNFSLLNDIKAPLFFEKPIENKHLCRPDKNFYYLYKSNILIINLSAGSRN